MNTKSFNDLGLNEESQKFFWILMPEFSFEIKKIRPWKVDRLPCVCGDCLDPPWKLDFVIKKLLKIFSPETEHVWLGKLIQLYFHSTLIT